MRIGRGARLALLGLLVGGLIGCDGSGTSGMPKVTEGLAAEVRSCLLDPESCPPDYPSTTSRYTDGSIPSPPITITSEELSQVCDSLKEHDWDIAPALEAEERNRRELAILMRKMSTIVLDLGFSYRWHDPESESFSDVDRWFQWLAEKREGLSRNGSTTPTAKQALEKSLELSGLESVSIWERNRQFHQLICKG